MATRTLPESPPGSETIPAVVDVRLLGVRKTYGDVVAVDHLELEIEAGAFFTLLGPSGSGKTTTLRLIAGFERPDEGRIELSGVDVSGRAPYERDVNTVFQDYALFPHMSVADNVGYGLRVKGVPRRERKRRVDEALELPEQTPDRASRITAAARERGLVLLSCGMYGNVIRILVPLSIDDDLLERGLGLLEEALGDADAA